MISTERREWLENLPDAKRRRALSKMSERQLHSLRRHWKLWAHEGQLPPPGDWHCWLVMAGRGFGKTRAGAEWVRAVAEADPTARIALVGASLGEARGVQVEGESGILAVSSWRKRPKFEPSRRLLTWPNGAEARLYSAGEPESLRGPQHSHACRTGPEGGDRQRGAHLRGLVASSYGLGRARRSPRSDERRGNLARRRRCDGKLVGPRRNAGRMVGRWLAIRRPTARTARI